MLGNCSRRTPGSRSRRAPRNTLSTAIVTASLKLSTSAVTVYEAIEFALSDDTEVARSGCKGAHVGASVQVSWVISYYELRNVHQQYVGAVFDWKTQSLSLFLSLSLPLSLSLSLSLSRLA